MSYWTGKVVIKTEDERGKVKKTTEQFLIDAESATEAEVKSIRNMKVGMVNLRFKE